MVIELEKSTTPSCSLRKHGGQVGKETVTLPYLYMGDFGLGAMLPPQDLASVVFNGRVGGSPGKHA